MAEKRLRSLLDFAITASAAVLPVMLGVLLLAGVIRPSEQARLAGIHDEKDRYVSVRHLAALKTFERAVVVRTPGFAPPPSAEEVTHGLPQCRDAWNVQEMAGQLAAFDAALLRFSSRPNGRVGQPVGLDGARWLTIAHDSLSHAVEAPQYPGRVFTLSCEDLAGALHAVSRADARMLEALEWRGTVTPATLASWRPDQQVEINARHVMRRNPWNGIAGCIYLGHTGNRPRDPEPSHFIAAGGSLHSRLCAMPAMSGAASAPAPLPGEPGLADAVDDPRWAVPPSLYKLLEPLEALRQPSRPLYRFYTEAESQGTSAASGYRFGPNRIVLDGASVDVGFSVRLTIDPGLQSLAQKMAACYTGRQDVCRAMGVQRAEDQGKPIGHRLLEQAMVRMAAVAVIDIPSGRIEALAGSMSPCARQEVDGPGRDARCDKRLPYPVRFRPDALLNQAVFHDAMPASTIKPIMAAAFFSDADVGARWMSMERAALKHEGVPARDSLRGQLMRSDSARFLDRMLCFDKGFTHCRRPWEVQHEALAFGWNVGCATASADCGKQDLLFGRAADATAESGLVRPLSTMVAYGRLMSEPSSGGLGTPMHFSPPMDLDAAILRRCALGADGVRGSKDDWEKCRGGHVVDIVAEGWGQGHARASALGVAGMMATLGAAANGQSEVRRPYLVESIRGAEGELQPAVSRWGLAAPQPLGISREAAEVILSGLSYSHRAGTARSACEQVFDARRCRDIDWLAGKTGTPSFPSDGVSLDEIARECRDRNGAPRAQAAHAKTAICSSLRPYKWYVAVYRSDRGHGPWTKAIAVLSERNWLKSSGMVHGASDLGPNPSAEIALQIVGRHTGAIAGTAP